MLSSKHKLQAINSFNILDEVSRQNFFAIPNSFLDVCFTTLPPFYVQSQAKFQLHLS